MNLIKRKNIKIFIIDRSYKPVFEEVKTQNRFHEKKVSLNSITTQESEKTSQNQTKTKLSLSKNSNTKNDLIMANLSKVYGFEKKELKFENIRKVKERNNNDDLFNLLYKNKKT